MTHKIQGQLKPAEPNLTKTPNNTIDSTPQTSFSDHIAELRRRIFYVLAVFFVASALAYTYKDALLGVIMSPLGDEKLIYLTPGGGFNFIFQVALYAGLLVAAPMLIYQLYGFIRPALPVKAQRSAVVVVLVAFLLMLLGVAFGYFVAVPSALHFLSDFAGGIVTPSLTADSYLSFFLAYLAGLGILFELPLLLLFFHWINPMTPGQLLKSERFVILFAFVAAAIITPTPDVLNQAMIAVPLLLIYQLGVITVLLTIRNERKKEKNRNIPQKDLVRQPIQKAPAKKVTPPAATVATVPIVTASPGRSVDGFSRSSPSLRPKPRLTLPPRELSQGTRPLPSRPSPERRSLNIDGFPMRNS